MYNFGLSNQQTNENSAESILGKLEMYTASILNLQKAINSLTVEQNLAKVHLKKYQDDYIALRAKYKQLRTIIENNDHKSLSLSPENYRVDLSADANSDHAQTPVKIISDDPLFQRDGNILLFLSFYNSKPVKSICIDSESKLLAFTDGFLITLLNLESRTFINSVNLPELENPASYTHIIQFTPDNKYISITNGSKLLFFHVEDLKIHTEVCMDLTPIVNFQFSLEFDILIVCYRNAIIGQVQYSTLQPIKSFKCQTENISNANITGMELIGDQMRISNEIGLIVTLKLPNFDVVNVNKTVVKTHYGFVTCPIFDKFITLSRDINYSDSKNCAAFSGNGEHFVTASNDYSISFWDSKTEKLLFKILFHQGSVLDIRHSKSHNSFATCSADGYACFWKYSLLPDMVPFTYSEFNHEHNQNTNE